MDPAVWLRGDEAEGGEGARLLSPYSQSAWLYIAISVLAETVAQIPFRIARLPRRSQTQAGIPKSAAKYLHDCQRGSPSPGGEGRGEGELYVSTDSLRHHSITPPLRRLLGENLLENG